MFEICIPYCNKNVKKYDKNIDDTDDEIPHYYHNLASFHMSLMQCSGCGIMLFPFMQIANIHIFA